MAKQIEGVYDRILECAKREFLEKGYADASLRTIAAGAATSTNSIYVRFKDKEGLFTAIVEPAMSKMMELFSELHMEFHGPGHRTGSEETHKHAAAEMDRIVDYMYDYFDDFRLLLDASYGTRFHNFVEELVRIAEECLFGYINNAGLPAGLSAGMARDFLHMVVTSYFEGMFEVVRHGMSREDAKTYVAMLGKYHHTGFRTIFTQNAV